MSWPQEQLTAAVEDFPSLALDGQTLIGTLCICGALRDGSLVLNPTEHDLERVEVQASFMVDSYRVEIGFENFTPYVRLPGERLPNAAKQAGLPLLDLHVYGDLKACFSAPQEILDRTVNGMTPSQFIYEFVLPFLYGESFRERHGYRPWPDLAHGSVGLVEWLGRKRNPSESDISRTALVLLMAGDEAIRYVAKRARGHLPCPCKSGKKLKDCHPDIKPAVDLLRGAVAQGRLPAMRNKIQHVRSLDMRVSQTGQR